MHNISAAVQGSLRLITLLLSTPYIRLLMFLQKITSGALWTELAAVALLGATVFAFDYFNSTDSGYYTY